MVSGGPPIGPTAFSSLQSRLLIALIARVCPSECFFERGNASFNVLPFDSFDGMAKDTLGRPQPDGGGYIRIGHELQDGD